MLSSFRILVSRLLPGKPESSVPAQAGLVFRRATRSKREAAKGFVPIGLPMRTAMARDPNYLPRSARGEAGRNLHHSAR